MLGARDPLPEAADEQLPAAAPARVAVRLTGAGMRYRVLIERYTTFKEHCIQWLKGELKYRDFWALRDVSFEIRRGESFGIIGENGSGKSTLLKLIAGVLRPSEGRIQVAGFVAPLLELGCGFHPELTGRENIYLKGMLMGLSRREVEDRIDRIVDFSEIGEFLDAPLRTYSTGMQARLGFAVATERHPDVLICDEVLGVGDDRFQWKCVARLDAIRKSGATVILVSHSPGMIETTCDRAAWLHRGKLERVGDARLVARAYESRPNTRA